MISPILPIRVAQFVLSIIILGMVGYVAHQFNKYTFISSSPSEANYLIFVCIWTWLALVYLMVVPQFLPRIHNQWATLAVELVTNIFWFAGWIAFAVWTGDYGKYWNRISGTSKAAAVFSTFEWLLFVGSSYLVCRQVWMQRKTGDVPQPPAAVYPSHNNPTNDVESNNQNYGGFNPMETPKPYEQPQTHMQPGYGNYTANNNNNPATPAPVYHN